MFRLPEGWSEPTAVRDVVVADGVRIRRSGVATVGPSGEQICGAAADIQKPAVHRAWYELAERVSIVEALAAPRSRYALFTSDETSAGKLAAAEAFPRAGPRARWVPARSNGIAIHVDWARASARAHWELVERDRILRAWLGQIAPCRIEDAPTPKTRRYEWIAYSFPADDVALSSEIHVAGVFGFPRSDRLPLVMGFAARPALADAVSAASMEGVQQLAFLWGLPVVQRRRAQTPSPRLHLDTYQRPSRRPALRAWLDGEHVVYAPRRRARANAEVRFIDLTPPWLQGKARVVKALSAGATPFGFGELPSTRRLPVELRIHPIP